MAPSTPKLGMAKKPRPGAGPGATMRTALFFLIAMTLFLGALNISPGFVGDVTAYKDLHFIQLRNSLQTFTGAPAPTRTAQFANPHRPRSRRLSSERERGSQPRRPPPPPAARRRVPSQAA